LCVGVSNRSVPARAIASDGEIQSSSTISVPSNAAVCALGAAAMKKRAWTVEIFALALLGLATGVGHWIISARMAALRLSMGRPIDEVAQNDPLRLAFNDLHGYSVAAMTTAMLASLVAFILIARRNRRNA